MGASARSRTLAEHPLVHECEVAAVERSDRRMTDMAFVVLAEYTIEANSVTKTLQDYVKEFLLPYKYPPHRSLS
jgi:acyl-coenzyme A synthetase/AMP-(fatty) acid ligase